MGRNVKEIRADKREKGRVERKRKEGNKWGEMRRGEEKHDRKEVSREVEEKRWGGNVRRAEWMRRN